MVVIQNSAIPNRKQKQTSNAHIDEEGVDDPSTYQLMDKRHVTLKRNRLLKRSTNEYFLSFFCSRGSVITSSLIYVISGNGRLLTFATVVTTASASAFRSWA